MSTGMNFAGAAGLPPLFNTPTTHPNPAGTPDIGAPGGGKGPAAEFQRQYEEAGASRPAAGTETQGTGQANNAGQDSRSVFQLQDGLLLSPVTGSSRSSQSQELFAAEGEALRDLPGRWEGFREKIHARLAAGSEISNEEMVLMQLELNEISFQVETASKVVEHATSGTKTILQTQA